MALTRKAFPPQELVKSLFDYDPATGIFVRRKTVSSRHKCGQIAGHLSKDHGYILIGIQGKNYFAHRLAWFYVHGHCPDELDHKNGHRADNRIDNLRPATRQQNSHNQQMRSDNTSGFKGVRPVYQSKKWQAFINDDGLKTRYLGIFDTKIEAHKAYVEAANRAFGEFSRA